MKFRNPPVVETVISVQFQPLPKFGAGQLGAFWKELGSDWPLVTDAPTIEPSFERFSPHAIWEAAAFGLKVSQQVDIRLQIRNAAKDRMIQVQNGRFFYNWLGTPGADYPSYETVRPEFDEYWEKFRAFVLSQIQENTLKVSQWEMIYVNHIPRGSVWQDLSGLPQALTFLHRPQVGELSLLPDGVSGEWRFEIVPEKGRLYVRLGMTKKDDNPCLVMTLTARGPVDDGASSLDEGLRLGHRTITDAFCRLTTAEAHRFWGVQDAHNANG